MNPFTENVVAQAFPVAHYTSQSDCGAASAHGCRTRSKVLKTIGKLALVVGLSGTWAPVLALDLNTATATQLETIRGLGPKTAELIVKERERGGSFESLEDLAERVRGIGQKKAQALQAAGLRVEVDASKPLAATTTAPASSQNRSNRAVPATRPKP